MTDPATITTLADVIGAADERERHYRTRIWWRGQARLTEPDSDPPKPWRLVPGVYRLDGGPGHETSLLLEFMLQAGTRHESCPDDSTLDEWLFLAQHYRLPTRLLDWTGSPLLATYFAVTDHPEETGSLFALSPYILNYYQTPTKIDGVLVPSHEYAKALIVEAFGHDARKALRLDDLPTDAILAVGPKEVDIRMLVQQAAFTIHGKRTAIEDLNNADKFLTRYEIPADAKPRLQRELALVGLRRSDVFPDLENLAGDLAVKRRGSAAAQLGLPDGAQPKPPVP